MEFELTFAPAFSRSRSGAPGRDTADRLRLRAGAHVVRRFRGERLLVEGVGDARAGFGLVDARGREDEIGRERGGNRRQVDDEAGEEGESRDSGDCEGRA